MMEHRTRISPTVTPESHAPVDGRRRVVVERLQPVVDRGRVAIMRTTGESVAVTGDMCADGYDLVAGVLKYRWVAEKHAAGPPPAEPAPHPPEGGRPGVAFGRPGAAPG